MRTRPGRSATKRRPSGANAIAHGTSRLDRIASACTRTPSCVVNVTAEVAAGGVVAGGCGSQPGVVLWASSASPNTPPVSQAATAGS